MFPISAITDEISQDFEHALDVLLEYDVRLAELRGLWDKNISNLTPDELEAAREALARRHMGVVAIGSPAFKCRLPQSDSEAEEQLALLRHCCRLAGFFGTGLVRVFAFLPEKGNPPALTPEVWEKIPPMFQRAVEIAEEEQVVLALENEHACYIATGVQTAELLQKVSSERLRVTWDPGNAFCARELPYPDGYQAVCGKIVHVHMKDAVRDPDTGWCRFLPIGEGEIDFAGQLRALKKDGYQGALSIETHYQPEGGTREDGSRRSLENLLRILKTEVF